MVAEAAVGRTMSTSGHREYASMTTHINSSWKCAEKVCVDSCELSISIQRYPGLSWSCAMGTNTVLNNLFQLWHHWMGTIIYSFLFYQLFNFLNLDAFLSQVDDSHCRSVMLALNSGLPYRAWCVSIVTSESVDVETCNH